MPTVNRTSPSRAAAVIDAGQKTANAAIAGATAEVLGAKVGKLEKEVARLEYEKGTLEAKSRAWMSPDIGETRKQLEAVKAKLGEAKSNLKTAQRELNVAVQRSAVAHVEAAAAQWKAGDDFKVAPKATLPITQQQAATKLVADFKATRHPAEAATLLAREFRVRPDAAFQAQVWSEVKQRLPEMAKDPNAMNALVAIAEYCGVDIEKDIAAALAKNAPEFVATGGLMAEAQPFVNTTMAGLQKAIRNTGRMDLAQRFVEALNAAGKPMAASAVAAGAAKELGALRADFVAKQKTVEALNTKLGMLVGGFGQMMTDDDKRQAIEAFRARHREDFSALEQSAQRLAQALPMAAEIVGSVPKSDGEKALEAQAKEVLKLAGALADTQAGEAALTDAMKKQESGESTWIEKTLDFAQTTKDGEKIVGTLGTALFRQVAINASKLADGNLPAALSKVESMAKYAKLMGVKPEQAEALGHAMSAVAMGAKGAEQNLNKAILDLEGTPMIPADGKLTKTLKGVGLALSVVSLAKNGMGDTAFEKTKNVATALNVGADALALTLSIVGKAEGVQAFAKGASSKLGVITGALDLVSGYKSLFKGDFQEAGTTLASSAGALLMMTPGGQIPGAILTVGSMVASWVFASRKANQAEAADEADAKAFLVAGGVKPEIAASLSDLLQKNRRNVGPFLQQLSEYLGMSPAALLSRLNKPELAGKVRELVTIIKAMEPGDDGKYATRSDHDVLAKESGYQNAGFLDFRPKSVAAVVDWMKQNKMFGG